MFKWFGIVNHTPHTKVAAFAEHLREGRLMASRCTACGHRSFPPRADCEQCLGAAFEFVEISGKGTLLTWTRVTAAPSGFESLAPYTLGVLDLDEGGRALAPIGASLREPDLAIGMPLVLVPRLDEAREEIHVGYTLESAAGRGGRS